ncbi:hypothetical protein N8I77_004993 [Diaporthe amygdali]|uniref:Uncharacterized protein n=1 Tax=Phomopsis amygdali TaxID=1214568 RepID=A0AAD9W8D1_PHOAM|nr:hypothetical protein N8I77_004993 [Diaporthe amygdali]
MAIMEQVARDENFGADKFPIAQRFTEYMKTLQSNINTESNNRVPQLFNTLQTDLNILRPLALHPDQVGLYNGVETKLNFFRSFAMNSGKWTWDSDLGMNTYHTPPSPPSPASPTSECGELSGISTCSAAAATDSTKMTSMSATEVTHSQPTPSSSPACTSDSDCSSFSCPPGQRAACVEAMSMHRIGGHQ